MMFRSLFFAPLLVAADVEEQSVLLQMKGRAETQVLMQRASEGIGSETLRNLEMGLMAKGSKKVATAKCAYFMKTANEDYGGNTPCETIAELEDLYEELFDDFEDFRKTGEKVVKDIMNVVDQGLKAGIPINENFTHSFVYNSTNLGLSESNFNKAFLKSTKKELFTSMNHTELYSAVMENPILEKAEEAFEEHLGEVQLDVMSILGGGDILGELPTNFTFNVTALKEDAQAGGKGIKNAKNMFQTYADTKLNMFLNQVGEAFGQYWEGVLQYEGAETPFAIDWSVKKEVKEAGDAFWLLSSGIADGENVEPKCTSAEFNAKRPAIKDVCKGRSSPKCIDELMFHHEDTEVVCEVADQVSRKVRNRKFTDPKFLAYCNATTDAECPEGEDCATPGADCEFWFRDTTWTACKKANDVRKACKAEAKYIQAQERKALKAKKKAFNAAKKACYKACKKVDRKERKDCKKACKTDFHKSMLANFTVSEPEPAE